MALVVFDLHSVDVDVANQLGRTVLHRKRITDEVGWYGEDRIALLLPDTDSCGAQVIAEHICKMVLTPIPYCIYRYPVEDADEKGGLRPTTTMPDGQFGTLCRGVFDLQPLIQPKVPSWKRSIDLIGSLSGLLLTFPLFAVIALFIKIVSPGPVFYRQERLGKGRRPFQLLKFRSMHADADLSVHERHLAGLLESDVPMTKLDCSHDSRVIPLGNLLRWSCLDELPQLINVLRGEMSLVGPRPCLPYEAERYQLWQTRRFDFLPGITGLWQVSGKNRLTFKQMVRLDIRYGLFPSFLQDFLIVLRTVPTMVGLLIESLRVRTGLQVYSGEARRKRRVAHMTKAYESGDRNRSFPTHWSQRYPLGLLLTVFLLATPGSLCAKDPPATEQVTLAPNYLVQPGDILEVFVWKEPDLSRKVLVRPDGFISFPLIQDLQAAGIRPSDLKRSIEERLKDYVSAPNVTIVVDAIRSYTVFVVGKVQKPGEYLREQPVSVLQSLSLAGGFQEYANRGSITVFRNRASGNLVFKFDYDEVVEGKRPSQNIILQSGDVVVVP